MAVIDMDHTQLEKARKEDKPVLVDYWAPWCAYCRRLGPAYDNIAEAYGDVLTAGRINIDENPQLAQAEQITVLPTLVLYRKGRAAVSITAPESKAAVDRFLRAALAE